VEPSASDGFFPSTSVGAIACLGRCWGLRILGPAFRALF